MNIKNILIIVKSLTLSLLHPKQTKKAEELVDYIEQAAGILKGRSNSFIGLHLASLLIMKRINDVYDMDFHWEELRNVKANVGAAVQKMQKNFVKAGFRGLESLFEFTQWEDINHDKLIALIEHMSKVEFTTANVPDDLLVICYDHILSIMNGWYCYTIVDQYNRRSIH